MKIKQKAKAGIKRFYFETLKPFNYCCRLDKKFQVTLTQSILHHADTILQNVRCVLSKPKLISKFTS